MKKSRIVAAVILLAILAGLVLARCGASSGESQPSADLSLIGVGCDAPGEIRQDIGASFVCVSVNQDDEAAEPTSVFFPVATSTDSSCDKAGDKRKTNGIVEVCGVDKSTKKRKWVLTAPLPLAVTAFIDIAETTDPAELEEAGVPIPEAIAALPGMQEFATPASTTSPQNPGTSVASTTTSDSVAPTTSATIAPTSTTSAVETSTTIDETSTTIDETTTTIDETTTTTTTLPEIVANPTCAMGGPCNVGDVGPAGGIVLLADFILSEPSTLIEVAPTTWFGNATRAGSYTENLVYGGYDDWRVPNLSQLLTMRRERARFVCPSGTRCTNGFVSSTYWAAKTANPTNTLSFAGKGDPQLADPASAHFVRPIRVLQETPQSGDGEVILVEPEPS